MLALDPTTRSKAALEDARQQRKNLPIDAGSLLQGPILGPLGPASAGDPRQIRHARPLLPPRASSSPRRRACSTNCAHWCASGDFTLGKPVSEFEAMFAAAIGVKHAIGVGSGTDASRFRCARSASGRATRSSPPPTPSTRPSARSPRWVRGRSSSIATTRSASNVDQLEQAITARNQGHRAGSPDRRRRRDAAHRGDRRPPQAAHHRGRLPEPDGRTQRPARRHLGRSPPRFSMHPSEDHQRVGRRRHRRHQ